MGEDDELRDAFFRYFRANPDASITSARVDGEPVEEAEHFFVCKACGQAVDMRDLGDVFHHEETGHRPRPQRVN